jgi:hypothetical protein
MSTIKILTDANPSNSYNQMIKNSKSNGITMKSDYNGSLKPSNAIKACANKK